MGTECGGGGVSGLGFRDSWLGLRVSKPALERLLRIVPRARSQSARPGFALPPNARLFEINVR